MPEEDLLKTLHGSPPSARALVEGVVPVGSIRWLNFPCYMDSSIYARVSSILEG